MNPDEIIAAVEAFKRDGRVMVRTRPADGNEEWVETMHPVWNFTFYDYAPCPPAPREIWVNIYSGERDIGYTHPTEEDARRSALQGSSSGYVGTFLFRQVLDDA